MTISSDVAQLRRQIISLRVKNAEFKHFVPEESLASVVTQERVAQIVSQLIPLESKDEVIKFIVNGARKVFSILILIDYVRHISPFITRDQMQRRPIDNLLPLHTNALENILDDKIVVDQFYEKQWEFCAPVFSREIVPRALDVPTVLPYLSDTPLASGAYGVVHKITIHYCHRPDGYDNTEDASVLQPINRYLLMQQKFVRKELEYDNSTYDNEVRVLSILQRLNHPNILKLLACYTHKNKHNIISPYVTGGTLHTFLQREKASSLTQGKIFYMISGLASAVWALHEIFSEDTGATLKGLHQDLRPVNVLYDGNRLILADFGLSSIKSAAENSNTPFKGRVDYYQAPECADLGPPYEEHETTRATDIFALGCIITDMIVYHFKGRAGLDAFQKSRNFILPPFHYHLYHNGTTLNEAVADILHQVSEQEDSASLRNLAELVSLMLDIDPKKRPLGRTVTAKSYAITIAAFTEQLDRLFADLGRVPEALVEQARLISWRRSFETLFYVSLPATVMAGIFESTIDTLGQMQHALQDIDRNATDPDPRTFIQVRQLNTELLNMLPEDGRIRARTQLKTIVLKSILPDKTNPVYETLRSAFAETEIVNMVNTKRMVVQVEQSTELSAEHDWNLVPGPLDLRLSYMRHTGKYKIAKVHGKTQTRVVLEETIQYQDQLWRSKIEPRVHALCDLLSSGSLPKELRVPSFYGLHDDQFSFSFGLLYDLTRSEETTLEDYRPTDLHELLAAQKPSQRPSLEIRLGLASSLAESLAAFHDVDWYHKDLTSHSVLFLPSNTTTSQWITEHYLIGFQHSRGASTDFSDGPLQDKNHRRYHEPRYLSMENRQFRAFRPEYDYYSLGILLVEIAFWDSIDVIMRDYADKDDYDFSQAVIKNQLPQLCFIAGTNYAAIVQQCLTGFSNKDNPMKGEGVPHNAETNLLFKEKVVMSLKLLSSRFNDHEEPRRVPKPVPGRKRKNSTETVLLHKKRMT